MDRWLAVRLWSKLIINSSVLKGLGAVPCQPLLATFETGIVGKPMEVPLGFSNFCAVGSSNEEQITVAEPQVYWLRKAVATPVKSPVRSAAVGTTALLQKKLLSWRNPW